MRTTGAPPTNSVLGLKVHQTDRIESNRMESNGVELSRRIGCVYIYVVRGFCGGCFGCREGRVVVSSLYCLSCRWVDLDWPNRNDVTGRMSP